LWIAVAAMIGAQQHAALRMRGGLHQALLHAGDAGRAGADDQAVQQGSAVHAVARQALRPP
jgi:hypothetical protein